VASLLDYEGPRCVVEAKGGKVRTVQEVVVPVTSLCPCSKKIADYGAHNQRSAVTNQRRSAGRPAIEQHVRFAEDAASSETMGAAQAPGREYVTERAYDNPKFVRGHRCATCACAQSDDADLAYSVATETRVDPQSFRYALVEHDKRARPALSRTAALPLSPAPPASRRGDHRYEETPAARILDALLERRAAS